jgi:hypothetical protein
MLAEESPKGSANLYQLRKTGFHQRDLINCSDHPDTTHLEETRREEPRVNRFLNSASVFPDLIHGASAHIFSRVKLAR